MRATELKKYKRILLERRQQLTANLSSMADEALKPNGSGSDVEESADFGSDQFEQEFTLGLMENEQNVVREIDRALDRIEDGFLSYQQHASVFVDLAEKRTQVSTHTQIYQVVLMTITMVAQDLGLDAYIDHGSFDGWRAAPLAEEAGVAAILGPRQIQAHFFAEYRPGFFIANDTDGAIFGMAERYQTLGHSQIGFNTDSPVIPQETLQLQAGMAVRYGFDDSQLDAVRGLTIVPAMAVNMQDRIGSIEVGKDADMLRITGDPADPRSWVKHIWQDGESVYDGEEDGERLW